MTKKHTRDGLRSLLENDYDVYVAPDIAGAIDVLDREQVDVLLTDLRLGSEDGMSLIDRALKMPRPPALHHDDGLRVGGCRGGSD